jgi:hypothetical protein
VSEKPVTVTSIVNFPEKASRYRTKVCTICGNEYLPTSGHQRSCSECGPLVHQEKKKVTDAQYYILHVEKCRERNIQSTRRWRLKYPDRVKASLQRWMTANPEKVREIDKRRNLAHPGRNTDNAKKWGLANPEKTRANSRKQKAQRRALGFHPLNTPFPGCVGHHINKTDVIYLPRNPHRSVSHDQWTGRGMVAMNALAGKYLTEDWT